MLINYFARPADDRCVEKRQIFCSRFVCLFNMNESEEILVHVERFLRDDLAKESLSIEVEKTRQLLLDKLNKHLYSDENADVLRKRRQTSKKSKRWSCDVKHLSPENVSEDGVSKRQSKSIEKKEANFYEKNFSFISGEQSDSGDSYESLEDQKSLNSSQSDKKPDQKRFSKRTSKAKVDSELSTLDKNYEGQLYKKGKLNSWRKLHCLILDRWLVCHTKDSKQLYRIKLQGYDATHQRSKEGGGKYEQEIRLTGPGLKTYIFYAKDKVEAELWVIELTKAIQRARDCSNNNNNNVTSTDSTNYTPSNSLQEPENSYDVVDGSTVEQGTTATSNNSNSNSAMSSKPSIFHNLINKVKQKAMAAFDSVENLNDKQQQQQQQHASGVLQVTFDDFSKPNWMQRFCVIRSKQLEVYKNNASDRTEMVVPLSGVGLTLIPSSDFFVLCLNNPRQKMYIKFSNHSELNKWYQNLQRASQVLPEVPFGDADASLYDEIGESQGSSVQRPPVPECPAPMTPDVIGALMNMDEVGYMDVLECRQPILMDSNRRSQSRAYEEVSLYINRDTDCERSHKSATPTTTTSSAATAVATSAAAPSCGTNSNASKSFHYCPMWKGQSSRASSTSKPTTTTASSSVARTTSTAASSGQSYFRSTVSTAPSTTGPPGPSIRSKVTGSLATDSSSTPSLKAKKLSDFNEAREKFLTSSSSSLSSKNNKQQQQQQAPFNPSPNKWTTNLARGMASSSVSNNLDEVDAATAGGSGGSGGCTLRQHDRSLSANRNSNPNLEADKRGSGCSLKSNIVQEKLKIFQKN